jgi:hypothetical protein
MSQDAQSHQDRRRSERVYKHNPAKVYYHDESADKEVAAAQVMNISNGGVRFVSAIAFPPGEIIRLNVNDEDYRGKVLECSKRFNGYAIRCQFVADADAAG